MGSERYSVRRRIGGGPRGVVYEAWDRKRRAVVALKTLRRFSGSSLYKLKREFRALADLSHPNLVTLYELVGADQVWFIVMEMVRGPDFVRYVRGAPSDSVEDPAWYVPPPPGQEPLPRVCDVRKLRPALVQLLRGLAALHDTDKLHLNIKPSNVLVTAEGRVVLVDFTLVHDASRRLSDLSLADGMSAKIARYLPPEQAQHPAPSADAYAVGVLLYEALTGQSPYSGSLFEMLSQKRSGPSQRPRDVVMGVPPDLDVLCMELLAVEPEDRPSIREALRRLGEDPDELPPPRPRPIVAGRERERQLLEDAWSVARSGHAVVVLLRGASGMGRSALAQRFTSDMQEREAVTLLEGRCYERETMPFKAVDSMVDGLARYLEDMPPDELRGLIPDQAAYISRLFPVLDRQFPAAPRSTDADPGTCRKRAFFASKDLFRRLCERQPLLLYLDDLQWGDADSARLVASSLRGLRHHPVMLLASYRDEADPGPFIQTFLELPDLASVDVREVVLSELSDAEALAMARSFLQDCSPDAQAGLERVVAEAHGNPYLLSELSRRLCRMVAQETLQLESLTLERHFHERLAELPLAARRLMEALSLAGHPLSVHVLARAADADDQTLEAVTALRRHHFVRTISGLSEDLVEPYHELIARAVLSTLDAPTRAQLHGRLADAMEVTGWDEPVLLMEHYLAAGQRERAGDLALGAAGHAADALAFSEAARLYRQALKLGRWNPVDAEMVWVKLAEVLLYAGHPVEAAEAWLEAADVSEGASALDYRRRAAAQFLFAGHLQEGLRLVDQSLQPLGLRLATSVGWAVVSWWWESLLLLWRGTEFRPRPTVQIPERELQRIDACWFVTLALSFIDPVQGALFQARHLRYALDGGDRLRLVRAMANETVHAAGRGDRRRADAAYALARIHRKKIGSAYADGVVLLGRGVGQYLSGDWADSRGLLGRAVQLFTERAPGHTMELATGRIFLLRALLCLGELDEARDKREAWLSEAEEHQNLLLSASLRTDIFALLHLSRDDVDAARRDLEQARRAWPQEGWHYQHHFAHRAEALILNYEGRAGETLDLLLRHLPQVRRSQVMRNQLVRLRHYALLGATAIAAERNLGLATRALRAISRLDIPSAASHALTLRAALSRRSGQHTAWTGQLEHASRGFQDEGMLMHAAASRYRLGQLLTGTDAQLHASWSSAWFRSHGVVDPDAFATALGFPGPL